MRRFRFRVIVLFFVVCCSCVKSYSQGKTGILAGAGAMFYNGDLDDRTNSILTNSAFFHPSGTIGVSYWLSGYVEGSLNFVHGTVSAADSIDSKKANYTRNLSFQSAIDELSVRFEFNVNHRFERRRVNPYAFAGIAAFHFNPKAQLGDTWYELQPLGTEGQNLQGSTVAPYKLYQVAVPLGAGVAITVARHVRIKASVCRRILFTDYLDDVSGNYPDLESLSASSSGDVAVALSNRRVDGKFPAPNQKRGSTKFKDSYTTFDFSIVVNPGIMKCPATFKSTRIKRKNRG